MSKCLSVILAMVLVLCLVACNTAEPFVSSSEPGVTADGSPEITNSSEITNNNANNTTSNSTTSKNNSSVVSNSSKPSSSSKPTNTSSNNTTSKNNSSVVSNSSKPTVSKPATSNPTPTLPPAAVKPDPNPNHASPKAGDVYETNDYIYTYEWRYLSPLVSVYDPDINYGVKGGWNVRAKENKANYEGIYEAIYGKPIISMYSTFESYDKLEISPEIPKHVTNMTNTYIRTSLKVAPILPNGVKDLIWTFSDTDIIVAPVIPPSVTTLLATFQDCKKLTTAPVIPETVHTLPYTFLNCESLTGTITINFTYPFPAYNAQYSDTFSGTVKPIVLTGSAPLDILRNLCLTSAAGNVTVQ